MERPQNIRYPLQNKKTAIAVRLIIIFHLVGLVGLSVTVSHPLFLQLVPYHLLLMLFLLIYSETFELKLIIFWGIIFAAGFGVEWVGAHTGLLFGSYVYGKTLGLKLDGIPLIIGINWFLLIYSAGGLLQLSTIKQTWIRVLTGALILVLLDIVIEPAAGRFDYWHWTNNIVPVKNYICWFVISAILLFVFEKFNFTKRSIAGPVLLISQFIFFLALL